MKEITILVPDGKRADWVDGVLTLVDEPQADSRPVTERIKTFDDALRELGEGHSAVKAYRALVSENIHEDAKDILAYSKLRVLAAALNEGWQPSFTKGEIRWYAWYTLSFSDKIEDLCEDGKNRLVGVLDDRGLVFADLHYASASSGSYCGSRLAFKTEELALYAAKQFADLYGDFLLNKFQPIEK